MGLATRQWIILLTFYATYLIFGATVFYQIEHEAETKRRTIALQERIDINELLVDFTSPDDLEIQNAILKRVSTYCNKPVTDYKDDEFTDPYQWTFYHAVFFAFIVCSTLGYGNIAPTGTVARYFMIVYALIGMPMNMILYAYLGESFGSRFIKAYNRYKAYKLASNEDYVPHRLSMIGQITLSLIPAAVLLIFLPSCLFTYFEGWPYSVSVYYSFVTLLTIGFGDFVPTFQPHQERTFGIYFAFYQAFVLIWFVFGLSYILMLIGFIARGMRSKRIARLENQLSENIKFTHHRIWHEVSKDVGYLRRILNEAYIMRFRPVYHDECNDVKRNNKLRRSQSCPHLDLYSCTSPLVQRKRAKSEHYSNVKELGQGADRPLALHALSRHSETNLLRIDKEKTFKQQTAFDTTGDILTQVVLALNSFNTTDELAVNDPAGGLDLFPDDKILEDEESWSMITAPFEAKAFYGNPQKRLRARAKSMYQSHVTRSVNSAEESTPQRTWSGNNSEIQDYVNAQVKADAIGRDANMVEISIDRSQAGDGKREELQPNRRQSIFDVFANVFKRRNAENTATGDRKQPDAAIKAPVSSKLQQRRGSAAANINVTRHKPQFNLEPIRRSSVLSEQSSSSDQILENTTIADLIRAIESAHVKNALEEFNADLATGKSDRRPSLASQKRIADSLLAFNAKPTAIGNNRFNPGQMRRSSLAPPQTRQMITRQNSNPTSAINRFVVSPAPENPPTIKFNQSPTLQCNRRRFSAFPVSTAMPLRSSASVHGTPLSRKRGPTKQPISPLALIHPAPIIALPAQTPLPLIDSLRLKATKRQPPD